VVHRAAHILPAQGPISVFIHHNPLHAFESIPFERAVVAAGRQFGAEPFLPHERYREERSRGRIHPEDVEAALSQELGAEDAMVGHFAYRRELRRAMLEIPMLEAKGAALGWTLAETREFRRHSELWRAAVDAVRQAPTSWPVEAPLPLRHRDLLLMLTGADSDALVHPMLIRLAAAFLDQGIAYWPMPAREQGFARAVIEGYADRKFLPRWLSSFSSELDRWKRTDKSAAESAVESLIALGVAEAEWEPFVAETLLALRGYAGMMHQLETRPDLAPVEAPAASLLDFLAIRLLLERAAIAQVAAEAFGFSDSLSALRDELRRRLPTPEPPAPEERAYPLFQVALRLGRSPEALRHLTPESAGQVLREIETFTDVDRRRLLHLAYERRHRIEVLDALASRASEAEEPSEAPTAQIVFCIDEREESIRRHLEEIDSRIETLSAAGFFGVAMYYRGIEDAHSRPLCPIAIEPEHEVVERAPGEAPGDALPRRKEAQRVLGRIRRWTHVGSRTFTRGTLLTAVLGIGNAVPLTFRVLFPRLTARLRKQVGQLLTAPESVLSVERDETRSPSLGKWSGFTVPEMAAIVDRTLTSIGVASRLAPLVLIAGHGSSSLNNPHESAHDCGACGGGRGGPNARAFAQMANDLRVRVLLRGRGRPIPPETWFVGAYHNTCNDDIVLYDVERVPPTHRGRLAAIETALDRARARNAHERARRFEILPRSLTASAALAHVEARAEDLAQTRPEYGHATNAVCIVGRRARTRGLFLDRRAFLVSYDPSGDDARGTILAQTMAAVVPVVAGINLEYYFSYVDPRTYGCGTKLPHNVTGLLGVMDGHASDLRTGLPWQMVEIHEPVRLLLVVETEPSILDEVLSRDPGTSKLVENRWIQLATLSPLSNEIHLWTGGPRRWSRHEPEERGLPSVTSSREWYEGSLDHLPPARVIGFS
jgi:uncharacterized protein YbcC (UPF0753/DUF2309 family)